MELRLWICSIVALASAVKGFKITDVDPKLPQLQSGGKVVLTVTWETQSDDEKKGQILMGLNLDGTLKRIESTPVSQSPSQVTFNNVAVGKYWLYAREISNLIPIDVWQGGAIELNGPDNTTPVSLTTPPGRNQGPLTTDQTTGGTQPTTSASTSTIMAVTSTETQTSHTTTNPVGKGYSEATSEGEGDESVTSTTVNNSPGNYTTNLPTSSSHGITPSSNFEDSTRSFEPTSLPSGQSDGSKRLNKGGIIGGVVGGVVFIIILILALIYVRRRRFNQKEEPFNKDKMVRYSDELKFEYPFAAEFNPAYAAPKPFTEDVTTLYTSRASSPVDTDAITVTGTEVTGKPRQFARTDRQMEIEERVQQLQAQLIALHNQSKFHKSQGEERQIEEVREKIERLNALKSGYWALEQSDERPREMMY